MAERIGRGPQGLARWFDSNPEPLNIMAKSKNKKSQKQQDEEYLAFLKKRLDSKNYKASVTSEEYEKTEQKYDKVKLKLRLLN